MIKRGLLGFAVALLSTAGVSSAAVLFNESFDADHTANWTFNSSIAGDAPADNTKAEANYFFDYSTVGIPSAPGSGGTTRGLKLEANTPGTATFSGMSTSPTGVVLPNQYMLSAYVWQNFNGPAPGGGAGSTQLTNMTVGASGTDASFAGGTLTGVQVSASGDGGTNPDYRLYSAAFPDGAGSVISPTAHTGVYNAGNVTQSNGLAYYTSNFPGQAPPAAQTTLFAQQTGTAQAGSQAFAWHLWQMTKTDSSVTWSIDGINIATLPASLFPSTFGTDFSVGQADINSTTTDAAGRPVLFGLVDNITVSEIPEPSAVALAGIAALGLLRRRQRI